MDGFGAPGGRFQGGRCTGFPGLVDAITWLPGQLLGLAGVVTWLPGRLLGFVGAITWLPGELLGFVDVVTWLSGLPTDQPAEALAEKGGGLISMAKLAPTSRSQTERWDLVVPMAISYRDT